MSDMNFLEIKRKKEEEINTIHTQLVELEKWDLKPGQSIAERKTEEVEKNKALRLKENGKNKNFYDAIYQSIGLIEAKKVEKGTPIPPRIHTEDLMLRQELTNEAKKNLVPQGIEVRSHITYDWHTKLSDYSDKRSAFVKSVFGNLILPKGLERTLSGYLMNVDEISDNKEFMFESEKTVEEYNRNMLFDFLKTTEDGKFDLEARRRHFDRFVRTTINTEFEEKWMDEAFFVDNIVYLKNVTGRCIMMDNLSKEKEYFENLPIFEKELLNIYNEEQLDKNLGYIYGIYAQKNGVRYNDGKYMGDVIDKETTNVYEKMYNEDKEVKTKEYIETLKRYREKRAKACERQFERELKEFREKKTHNPTDGTTETQETDVQEETATPRMSEEMNTKISKVRTLFEAESKRYQEHKEVLDRLYQKYHHALDLYDTFYKDDIEAYDEVIVKYAKYNGKGPYGAVGLIAQEKKMEAKKIVNQLNAIEELMRYYLKNEWNLTESAKQLAKDENIYEEIAQKEADRKSLYRSIRNAHTVTKLVLPTKTAKKGWLQRLREKRQLKKLRAKHRNDNIDLVSADISAKIKDINEMKENSMSIKNWGHVPAETKSVIKAFVSGYKTNENGTPLDETEQQKAEYDNQFMAAYAYKTNEYQTLKDEISALAEQNAEGAQYVHELKQKELAALKSDMLMKRTVHLELMTDEILNISLKEDMLNTEYLDKHATTMKTVAEKLAGFKTAYEDEINSGFFEKLSPLKKALIRQKFVLSSSLTAFLSHYFASKYVNSENGDYLDTANSVNMEREIQNINMVARSMKTNELAAYRDALQSTIVSNEEMDTSFMTNLDIFRFEEKNSIFEYGLPSADGLMQFLTQQAGVSTRLVQSFLARKDFERLFRASNQYFENFKRVSELNGVDYTIQYVQFYNYYQNFIEECVRVTSLGAEDTQEQKILAALGYVAMKAQTHFSKVKKNVKDVL